LAWGLYPQGYAVDKAKELDGGKQYVAELLMHQEILHLGYQGNRGECLIGIA